MIHKSFLSVIAITFVLAGLVIGLIPGDSAPPVLAQTHQPAPQTAANWVTTGNKINATDFLGTNNKQPLVFKTNKVERMRIDTIGNVGIGTAAPCMETKLHVNGGSTGNSCDLAAIRGETVHGRGVEGFSVNFTGVYGKSTSDTGVRGEADSGFGIFGYSDSSTGVYGESNSNGDGVFGQSQSGTGVHGIGDNANGVGVFGESYGGILADGIGVRGISNLGTGVDGSSNEYTGVNGSSTTGDGVYGESNGSYGVVANSTNGVAMLAESAGGPYIIVGVDSNNSGFQYRFSVERATGNVRADGSYSGPADFAEVMPISGQKEDYTLGDVLSIGPDGKLMLSNKPNATNLAGVFSAKPGFLGDTEIAAHGIEYFDSPNAQQRIPVALIGIVPVKVTDENGPIHPGDLLTTSSTPGHAMKAKPILINGVEIYPTGTILGKALAAWDKGSGVIQVLVTLR